MYIIIFAFLSRYCIAPQFVVYFTKADSGLESDITNKGVGRKIFREGNNEKQHH